MIRLSRSRRASTALVFGVVFLGVMVLTAIQITHSSMSTSAALITSHRLLGQISWTRALLIQIDEGVEAYLLTGKGESLTPYETGRRTILSALDELAQLAPHREADVAQLRALVVQKLAITAQLVQMRSTSGLDAARKLFVDGNRSDVTTELDQVLNRLTNEERAAAEHRAASRSFRAQFEIVVVVLCGALSFSLVALAVHLLRREITERKRAERAVEENASLLRAVTDGTADLVYLKDLEGRFRMVNSSFARSVGAAAEDVVGRLDREVMPSAGEGVDPRTSDVELARTGRSASFEETRVIGGYARTFLSTKTVQRDVDGRSVGIIGIARDITDRIRAEAELRDSEQRFRALSNASPTGIWRCDRHGRCTYTNPQWQRMSGLSFDQALGEGWMRTVHPDDLTAAREIFLRAARDGADFVTEIRFARTDGEIRWVRIRGAPVVSPAGDITGYVGTSDDITDRRLVEESLRAANARLERQQAELQVLSEMGEFLQACQGSAEAYPIVAKSLAKLFAGTKGWIAMISPSRNSVDEVAAWGEGVAPSESFAPDECWALRRGKLHAVLAPGDGPRCAHLGDSPSERYLCVPMMAQGEALGVLHCRVDGSPQVAGADPGRHAGGIDLDSGLIVNAAEHVALALANVNLRETLRNQSIRDPLSSVYNRRFMEESLDREVQRAERRGWPIALIMLDLDHFKSFNDAYGHEAGDAIIRALGGFLQSRVRASDIVCRYGGEEFVIILPESAAAQTIERAELLCRDLRGTSFKVDDRALGPITLSAGVAVLPDHAANATELLRAADAALYRAKEDGRDRVVVATPTAATSVATSSAAS